MADSVIVCVHGRSEQWHLKDRVLEEFQGGISEGLGRLPAPAPISRDQIVLAFYADLFLPDAADEQSPPPIVQPHIPRLAAARRALDPAFQVNIARAIIREAAQRNRLPEHNQVPNSAIRDISWLHTLTAIALESLEKLFGAPRALLRYFVNDVDQYLHDANLRARVMGRVLNILQQQAGKEIILIGHSLGSVIAYDVVNTHPEIPITALITLGSPLGLRPFIYNELLPPLQRGRKHTFPASVTTWQNFYDRDDIVAIVSDLAPLFPGQNGEVVISTSVQNNPQDPHSLTGYLIQLAVAQAISNVLTLRLPPVSRFKRAM